MSIEVIDACVMINLLATSLEVELTQAIGRVWIMSQKAREETLFLDSRPDAEGRRERTVADLSRLERSGCLRVRPLDAEWTVAFVRCAEHLPDADASSVALAGALNLPLATDDPKERRVAKTLFPGLQIHSTLELLHEATVVLGLPEHELKRMASDLRWRGNFLPPKHDAYRDWYRDLLH